MSVADLNYLLATATIGLQLATIALAIVFFMRKRVVIFGEVAAQIETWGLIHAFLAAAGTVLTSLYYSEVLGFEPCPLCWWQRIFLYPQVVLFAMALWREKYRAATIDFSIIASILGAGVALYHHLLQMAPMGTLPCPATGSVSCATRILFEFNYITYPLMAFTLFVFLIVLMVFMRSLKES